eukprot:TRINITY_DN9157_c0_g1_i1.p2 TRINITY_DN9157_c0_g1~~TRINITY_DN9157_c0_g1_i1.p2  ORF type:complete len:150 (-),score=54.28 TRINITY_DN9157_c0_g1_i1:10-459(-)
MCIRDRYQGPMEAVNNQDKKQLLSQYKPTGVPTQMNTTAIEEFGIISKLSIDPVNKDSSPKISDVLYIQPKKQSPTKVPKSPEKIIFERKAPPSPESKEKAVNEKMAIFSIITTFVEIDTRLDIWYYICLLYTSPSPRDLSTSRMPSSA